MDKPDTVSQNWALFRMTCDVIHFMNPKGSASRTLLHLSSGVMGPQVILEGKAYPHKFFGKWPFIVELPIEKGGYPIVTLGWVILTSHRTLVFSGSSAKEWRNGKREAEGSPGQGGPGSGQKGVMIIHPNHRIPSGDQYTNKCMIYTSRTAQGGGGSFKDRKL